MFIFWRSASLWDTIPGESWTNAHLPHMGNLWQTKVEVPPKSNSRSVLALLGLLTGICLREYFKNDLNSSWVTKIPLQYDIAHKRWKHEAHCRVWRKLNQVGLMLLSWFSLLLLGDRSEPLLGSSACPEWLLLVRCLRREEPSDYILVLDSLKAFQ